MYMCYYCCLAFLWCFVGNLGLERIMREREKRVCEREREVEVRFEKVKLHIER